VLFFTIAIGKIMASKSKKSMVKYKGTVLDILSEWIGENPDREGLKDTPSRYLDALSELTEGYSLKAEDVLKTFEDGSQNYDELIFQGRVPIYSLCEHHLLPFFGVAHIGYLPSNPIKGPSKIVGLSKLARLTKVYSRRLQVQERLTTDIARALHECLDAKAVGVVLRCRHMCMESRGVCTPGTVTYTSALLGSFKNDSLARSEFLQFVKLADEGLHI